jgi:hypothetical protein
MRERLTMSGSFVFVAMAAALTGCTHAHQTYLADGQRGYSISCSGWGSDWSTCLIRAGRSCGPRGYRVDYSDEIDRRLIVRCRSQAVDADARSTTQSVR